MIARMWRAWVGSWDADACATQLLDTAAQELRDTPGNVATYLLRRADGDRTEFAVLSLWETVDAVRAMAGEDVEQLVPHLENAHFLHPDPTVIHYEIAESR